MTGVRVARYREVPLVFTHHTRYEEYTHYVPGDSPVLKRFVIELATRYANLCDRVFAPSESIEALLRERGVVKPISVVPTGVEVERFAQGDGASFRAEVGIPRDAFVVGHLGRLAPEKNLAFLGNAVISFLRAQPAAHFLVVGEGPSETEIRALFSQAGLGNRLHVAGILQPARLVDAYHAMDVFAFASQSETQGMVLTEAMAAGVPVVALDAPGVREVVKDSSNGYLLHENTPEALDIALRRISSLSPALMGALKESARHTAKRFSIACTAQRALACYESLHWSVTPEYSEHFGQLERILHLIRAEWEILQGVVGAAGSALTGGSVQGINK
jgi:glycosyltransferase involved in cell wall biosynthesis